MGKSSTSKDKKTKYEKEDRRYKKYMLKADKAHKKREVYRMKELKVYDHETIPKIQKMVAEANAKGQRSNGRKRDMQKVRQQIDAFLAFKRREKRDNKRIVFFKPGESRVSEVPLHTMISEFNISYSTYNSLKNKSL
jgi:hypothetical protein